MNRTASARSNGIASAIRRRPICTATSAIATAPPQSSTRPVWNADRSTSIVDIRSRSLISRRVVCLLAAPPERPEGRQAAQQLDEERAQPPQLGEPAVADRLRPAADDREQEEQDGAGEDEDERRQRVDEDDDEEDEERHRAREEPGRLVARHPRADRVEARREDAREVAGPALRDPRRAEPERPVDEILAEPALEAATRPLREDLEQPQARGAYDGRHHQEAEQRRDGLDRPPVEEHAGDDLAHQPRGGDRGDGGRRTPPPPHARGAAVPRGRTPAAASRGRTRG